MYADDDVIARGLRAMEPDHKRALAAHLSGFGSAQKVISAASDLTSAGSMFATGSIGTALVAGAPIFLAAAGGFAHAIGKKRVKRPYGAPAKPRQVPFGSMQVRWNKRAAKMEMCVFIRHPSVRVPVWVTVKEAASMPSSAFPNNGTPVLLPDAPEGIPVSNLGEVDQAVRLAAQAEKIDLPWGFVHNGTMLGVPVGDAASGVQHGVPLNAEAVTAIASFPGWTPDDALGSLDDDGLGSLGFGPAILASAVSRGTAAATTSWASILGSTLSQAIPQLATTGMQVLTQKLGISTPAPAQPAPAPQPTPSTSNAPLVIGAGTVAVLGVIALVFLMRK